MADYDVQITRGLRFGAGRKINDFVKVRGLRFGAKKRRDEWFENFGGSAGGSSGGSTKRKIRLRFL